MLMLSEEKSEETDTKQAGLQLKAIQAQIGGLIFSRFVK